MIKMSKTTALLILIVVIVLAIVIWLWLSKKDSETIVTPDGNGGVTDLINEGTDNYIEVTPSSASGMVRVTWFNQPTRGKTGSDINVSEFYYWIGSYLDQGAINQLQYDNAVIQYENLGYA